MRSWFRMLTVATGIGALGVAPLAWGQEEEEASSRTRVMPAEMELDASKRTAEADRKRDESIENLKRIIARLDAGPQKSELLFQLAEIWIEKAKAVYFQEWAEYDAKINQYFECVDAQGEEACGERPEPEHRQSTVYTDEALRLYEQILKDSPNYPRKDEVLFSLATNLYNKGEAYHATAIQRYRDLVTQYPNSRFVGDAYVAMGNHFFESNDLGRATDAFTRALENSVDEPRVYNYALYKLAWCEYNGGEYEGALQKFQEVADRAELAQRRNEIQLRNEAFNDMVLVWQKLEMVEEAHEYYQRKVNRSEARRLFARLAHKYFSDGDHALAIRSYRLLIDGDANDPLNPGYQKNIVESYEGLRERDKVLAEMRVLVDNYKPGSAWAIANKDNENALRSAYDITEEAMRNLVTDYHREAQRTKEVQTYRLAAQIYKDYLDSFSDSEHAYNLRFYYAEILWTLEEWEGAAEQYELVYEADAEGSYATTAAYNALLAYEKLIAIEKGELQRSQLRDDQKVDEDKDRGRVQQSKRVTDTSIAKDAQAEEISHWEQKMIAACDRYAEIAAADARLAHEEILVRYKAAFIYYDRKHFTEAAVRFGDIILKWPEDAQAKRAADLSLNILEIQEEWYELARLSRAFYENKALAKPGDKWTNDLRRIMEGAQYKYIDLVVLQKEGRKDEAAQMFRSFAEEFPKSEFADRALLYAMRIQDEFKRLDEVIAIGEQIMAQYPETEFRPEVLTRLASSYQDVARFEEAITYYKMFAMEWEVKAGMRLAPGAEPPRGRQVRLTSAADAVRADPAGALEASNALYNAALWTEGLGHFDDAVELYREYIQKYSTVEDAVPSATLALNIALIYEKGKDWEKAEAAFADFIANYANRATPGEVYFAHYSRAKALLQLGRKADARREFQTVTERFAGLAPSDQQRIDYMDAYAHAHFMLLEDDWAKYQAIRFDNVRTMRRALQAKMKALPELEAAYTRVLEIGSGEWGIAALTRIGQLYQDFARNLVESPDPPGLDEDQLMMYRIELEDQAFPLEEKAVEGYELALEKSYELKVYNDFTIYAQDQVNRFMPGEYGEIRKVNFTGSEFFAQAPVAESLATRFDTRTAEAEPEVEHSTQEVDGEELPEEAVSEGEAEEEGAPQKGVLILDKAAAK